MLRSSGFENSVLEESTLEIRRIDLNPMKTALHVASLASFAFEMDVCYRKMTTKEGVPGFAIELR